MKKFVSMLLFIVILCSMAAGVGILGSRFCAAGAPEVYILRLKAASIALRL